MRSTRRQKSCEKWWVYLLESAGGCDLVTWKQTQIWFGHIYISVAAQGLVGEKRTTDLKLDISGIRHPFRDGHGVPLGKSSEGARKTVTLLKPFNATLCLGGIGVGSWSHAASIVVTHSTSSGGSCRFIFQKTISKDEAFIWHWHVYNIQCVDCYFYKILTPASLIWAMVLCCFHQMAIDLHRKHLSSCTTPKRTDLGVTTGGITRQAPRPDGRMAPVPRCGFHIHSRALRGPCPGDKGDTGLRPRPWANGFLLGEAYIPTRGNGPMVHWILILVWFEYIIWITIRWNLCIAGWWLL